MYKYITIGLMLLLAACANDRQEEPVPETVYEDRMIPLEIRIPASEVLKRSPGDPGEDPRLPLPDYLYIRVAISTSTGVEVLRSNTFSHIESHWEQSANRAIYVYRATVNIPLVSDARTAELYITASREPLMFSPATPKSIAQLQNLKIKLDENPGVAIRDIYYDTTPISDYGQNQNVVTALCTHIGAKVDLQWNLTETFRTNNPSWRISSVSLSDMPRSGYLFQPTRNDLSDGTADPYIFRTDNGSNIYGRTDTYAFQRNDAAIRWTITFTDGLSTRIVEDTYQPSPLPDDVSYYRLFFTINGLESSQEITVTEKTEDE